jgi:hypothetical protein
MSKVRKVRVQQVIKLCSFKMDENASMIMTALVYPPYPGWMSTQHKSGKWFWAAKQHLWGHQSYNTEEAYTPVSEWLWMQEPDFHLDKIFKPQQMGQMGIMLKKWHISEINALCLTCNDLSFHFWSQVILLIDYNLYQILHAHCVCSGCPILPDVYTPVVSAEQYWLLNLLHFPSLPFS